MVDDYSGYKALFRARGIELGCLAHARRKYFDLNAAQANPIALEALEQIAALYAIEVQGKDLDVAGRMQLREGTIRPDETGHVAAIGGSWFASAIEALN